MTTFQLYRGDAAQVLRGMAANSVDSVVCDPPYGISFMNKHWDYDIPSVETWREVFRVLKPGGHVLSFAGTRTHHRMAAAIEDAGFEIRDMIAWVYSTGMPKSKNLGNGFGSSLKPALEPITVARKPFTGSLTANFEQYGTGGINIEGCRVPLTGDADAASFENNHRVTERLPQSYDGQSLGLHDGGWKQRVGEAVIPPGRWPANLAHDGSEDVLAAFPDAPGQQGDLKGHNKERQSPNGIFGKMAPARDHVARVEADKSAARFFYCTKASKKDRGEGNNHVTVKPTTLMQWLCRLVTPPNGTVLDPWAGSGSTGKAAILEGFHFVGIDLDSDKDGKSLGYLDIARSRILAVGGVEIGRTEPAPALSRLLSALRGNAVAVESTNGGGENEL